MPLSDFVSGNITADTRLPTKAGFGTPLVLGYHTAWPDRVRTYENLTDLAAEGIGSTGTGAATYWAVSAIFAQNPRVKKVKVGRRSNAFTQVVDLKVTSAVEGTVYHITIAPLGGSAQTFTRTVPAASSVDDEAAAIKVLIDASTPALSITTTIVGDDDEIVRCTAGTAGRVFIYTARNRELEILDSTSAPADIDDDLDACRVADDDWYGLHLDNSSKAECLAAAAWAETNDKQFFATSSDTENGKVGASNTLLKQLKAAGYAHTSTWCEEFGPLPSFLGAGVMGEEFPYDPGTQTGTYHGKSLRGVTVDTPDTTWVGEVKAQNGNTYSTVLGLNVTSGGITASGEFIDVIIGIDWLSARMKEAVFGVLTSGRRVPYTDGGVSMLVGAAKGVLMRAQGTKDKPGFLDPEQDVVVTAPLVADVDPADVAARVYPDLSFSSKISGAIHLVEYNGVLSVQ